MICYVEARSVVIAESLGEIGSEVKVLSGQDVKAAKLRLFSMLWSSAFCAYNVYL